MFTLARRTMLLATAITAISACASSRSLDHSFSDFNTNTDLKGILFTDRGADYSDIDLTIYEGRLLLTGSVRSEAARERLIANAWKADGVDQVIDELFVGDKTPIAQGFSDGRIDQELRARLLASRFVKSTNYKVSVSGGIVYMLGSAISHGEIEEAARIASSIRGVDKVVSHVSVRGEHIAAQR